MKVYSLQFTVYSVFAFLFLLFTVHCTLLPAYAAEATSSAQIADIGYSRLDPSSPLFFLKTIRENIEMKLAQTERVKNLRILEFATRRLRETKTLLGKNEDLIPPTLEKYKGYIDNLSDLKKDYLWEIEVKNNLSVHLKVLQQIYTKTSVPRSKMAIRATMHRIIERIEINYVDKIQVCDLFDKESSSSALNQTEQFVLKQRAQKCRNLNQI